MVVLFIVYKVEGFCTSLDGPDCEIRRRGSEVLVDLSRNSEQDRLIRLLAESLDVEELVEEIEEELQDKLELVLFRMFGMTSKDLMDPEEEEDAEEEDTLINDVWTYSPPKKEDEIDVEN